MVSKSWRSHTHRTPAGLLELVGDADLAEVGELWTKVGDGMKG
jgi:hypothetical protein